MKTLYKGLIITVVLILAFVFGATVPTIAHADKLAIDGGQRK